MNIEEAVEEAVNSFKRLSKRQSVRGLLAATLYNMKFDRNQVDWAFLIVKPDYKVPCGMRMRDYVETLAHRVLRKQEN